MQTSCIKTTLKLPLVWPPMGTLMEAILSEWLLGHFQVFGSLPGESMLPFLLFILWLSSSFGGVGIGVLGSCVGNINSFIFNRLISAAKQLAFKPVGPWFVFARSACCISGRTCAIISYFTLLKQHFWWHNAQFCRQRGRIIVINWQLN